MTPAERTRLARLIRRVRLSLWLAALGRALVPGVWGGALILAAGALAHWRLGVPDIQVLAALACAPALAGLAIGLRARPSPETAVLAADRQAEAQALLLSAWDLLAGRPPQPAGAPVVLAQAARALPIWERRIRAQRPQTARVDLWPPLLALLAALPLLALQPPRGETAGTADGSSPAVGPVEADPAPTDSPSLQSLVADLRRAAMETPPAAPMGTEGKVPGGQGEDRGPSADSATPQGLAASGTSGTVPRAPTTQAQAGGADPQAAAPAGNPEQAEGSTGGPFTGSGQDVAGTGPASAEGRRPAGQGVPPAPERHVALTRQGAGGKPQTAAGDTLGTAASEPVPGHAPSRAPPAALPQGLATDLTAFAPAQRRFVELWSARMQEGQPQ